jgi:hypothetical protein
MKKILSILLASAMLTAQLFASVQRKPSPPPPSVTLAWDPITDTTVVSVNLYYATASGAQTGVYDGVVSVPATSTSYTVSGPFVYGTVYYFAATCVDSNGVESLYSTEVAWRFTGAPMPLPPVLSIPFSNGGIRVQ